MNSTPRYYLGLDVAAESATVTIYDAHTKTYSEAQTFANDAEGLLAIEQWLREQNVQASSSFLCLEATGVYADLICYTFASLGFALALEAPHKTKRAFLVAHGKTDALDSRCLAEYAYRFHDQLTPWHPPQEQLENIKVLLTTREQLSQQLTAVHNSVLALRRKYVRSLLAEDALEKTRIHLKTQIKRLDDEIKQLISNHPTLGPSALLLLSIPGVGWLLTANLLLLSQSTEQLLNPRRLAAHMGICPFDCQSGTSVYKRPRSRRYGPARLRKLIYLAAMSLRTHQPQFWHYFLRKVAEGKPKRLVINNIANKLLRIVCSVLRAQTPFIANYKSVHPMLLKATA